MIVEHPAELRRRKWLAHGILIAFLVLVLFPFFMVVSISFREGNFATGSLLPENPTLEHWARHDRRGGLRAGEPHGHDGRYRRLARGMEAVRRAVGITAEPMRLFGAHS